MTKRLPVTPAPGPLKDYARNFDDLFAARAQREGFRRYLEGFLLPAERNKTLTRPCPTPNPWPERSARKRRACSGPCPSPGGTRKRSLEVPLEGPATVPNEEGVLVIDEPGDRKWGKKTTHVGKQGLGNIGKIRQVRAWLEPYIMLWRYWRAYTDKDPPEESRALLERVFSGGGLYLYVR